MKSDSRHAAQEEFNRAIAQQRAGKFDLAERHYRAALALQPSLTDALVALGDLLRRQTRLDEAASVLESACARSPHSAFAVGNLALLRIEQARLADARALAAQACASEPQNARWWIAAGVAARRALDADGAVVALRRACELAPDNASTWFELAMALERTGDPAASEAIVAARRLAPDSERLRWIEALLLPAIPDDDDEARAAVAKFEAGLTAIESGLRLDTPQQVSSALDAVLGVVTFQLHYLPGDHTDLQRRFGVLVQRIVAAAAPALCAPVDWPTLAHGGRIRVGFVSPYLHLHSVSRFFAAWITDLDRRRFESFVWYCGNSPDAWSAEIAGASDHFVHASTSLAEHIRAARVDVLIFLDIGLDPRMHTLAAMRLAPRQFVTFGHPVTSGLTTLDGFLGAELLEGDESQQQYRERLVRLPGLGIRMRRRAAAGDGAWLHAIAGDRPALLCLQNLIKLQPSFDAVLARVVRETGGILILFEHSAGQTQRFRRRIQRAFSAQGIDVDTNLHFVRALPYADFLAGVAGATLVLDSPGFSGGATSLDAISVGTPIVAYAGASARARQTAAMLTIVDTPELIAQDDDEYARIAIDLCRDEPRRQRLRTRLLNNAYRLFNAPDALPALQEFLIESVASAALAG